jgi:hypothetical protein
VSTTQATAAAHVAEITRFFAGMADEMSSERARWKAVRLEDDPVKGLGWGLRGPGKAAVDIRIRANQLRIHGITPQGTEAPAFTVEMKDPSFEALKEALVDVMPP